MMQLKLNTHPLETIQDGIFNPPPKPTIAAGSAAVPAAPTTPLFRVLPQNACDVHGCKKFGHAFPSPQALLEHKRAIHRPQRAAGVPPTVPHLTPDTSHLTPAKGKYQCKQCPETFNNQLAVARHTYQAHRPHKTILVDGKRRWPCPHCEYPASNSVQLRNHIRREHPTEAPKTHTRQINGRSHYCCDHCAFTTTNRNRFLEHADREHPAAMTPDTSPLTPPKPTHYLRAEGRSGKLEIYGTREEILEHARTFSTHFTKLEIGVTE